MFQLAWDDKGLTLNLNDVPDDILKLMIDWRNEKVSQESSSPKQF